MVRPDEVIENLADRIIREEQGGVLAWMLEGGTMLAYGLPETPQHKRLVEKWRAANNSALSFLLDKDCELEVAWETKGDQLFQAYQRWAAENGVRAFGRNNFFEAVDEGAGRFGVERHEHAGIVYFSGVVCATKCSSCSWPFRPHSGVSGITGQRTCRAPPRLSKGHKTKPPHCSARRDKRT